MGAIRVLTESDLREAVGFGVDELAAIEAVFPLISERVGSMPPIQRIDVPDHNGEIDVKSAYLPGYAGIAVKVSTGFFDNPAKGLPSLGGLMLVFDTPTGVLTSALFDNGYLTDLRTALAGAVAAKHLAIASATRVGVIGAGVQARLQLEALLLVREVDHVKVWARRPEQAASYAEETSNRLAVTVEPVDTPAEAADGVDVLVTTTPSRQPLIDAGMLHSGVHVTAVGSDAEHKQELDASVLAAADLIVCDHLEQSHRLGELRAAADEGVDTDRAVELGAIIAGRVQGRAVDDQTSVCDLTGTGAQDTAIATLAVERCLADERGLRVEP